MSARFPRSVRRLWLQLTVIWTAAWLIGLLVFGITASYLATNYFNEQIESRLRIQAIAVYGLAFFNEDGTFECDLLEYEDELFEVNTGLWIVEPDDRPIFHLSDGNRIPRETLTSIADQVVKSGMDVKSSGNDTNGQPYQLLAIPTYDVDQIEPRAAIIVVTNPTATNQAMSRLLGRTALVYSMLGLVGIFVGGLIAKWSLTPLAKFISDREKFLTAAAHELRTPLASIKAVVESESSGQNTSHPTLSRLEPLINKATDNLEDLLLYARLEAGESRIQKEPIRLDLLVEACLPENTTIVTELEEFVVEGDTKLLRVLIRNLLANALRHATSPEEVVIRLKRNTLAVENDGGGFPPVVLEQSNQDLRFTTSTTGSGYGLGLVQMIMKLHHGELKLSNPQPTHALAECRFKSSFKANL